MSLLIKNVLLDGEQKDIFIADNKFTHIKDNLSIAADTVIDGKNQAIVPAFYNTHTHASMMFLRGIGEDKELFSWLNEDIWPREAKLTPEMIYHLSRFAILEMIKTGTVFFTDMYFHSRQTQKAAEDMGVRAAISALGMDFFVPEKTAAQKEMLADFVSEPSASELILKGLSCHSVYTVSPELFSFAKDLAKQHDCNFQIHASETEEEVSNCINKYGYSPVELLNEWGILGKKTVLSHCLHLSEKEEDLLAETETTIAHCPTSSLKLNSGQMDLEKLLSKGILMTLGTDGVSSNNSLSMFSEMKIAALSAKNKAGDSTAAKVKDVFRMATENGAGAFGLNAGVIREGALADFLLLDMDNHFLLPDINLLSNLIYSADSSCITDVYCNGKALMQDCKVKEEEEIIQNFKAVCKVLEVS